MNLLKIMKVDFLNTASNLSLVFINTLFPLALIGILGFISRSSYGNAFTSYDYYGVTMLIFTVSYMGTITANTFMEKRIKKANVRLIYSPTHTSCIFLSKIFSSFIFGLITFTALMMVEQGVLNINLGGKNFIYVYIVVICFVFFMCCFGAFMCCVFKSEEAANKIQSPILMILPILGGLFFPLKSLGRTVNEISCISPWKWVNESIIKIIYDKDLSFFVPVVSAFIAGSIVLIILCRITFKEEAYI